MAYSVAFNIYSQRAVAERKATSPQLSVKSLT